MSMAFKLFSLMHEDAKSICTQNLKKLSVAVSHDETDALNKCMVHVQPIK